MIFSITNSSSKKCEIKCPESRKKLTTQYEFCLMDADAKCLGEEGRLNADTCCQLGGVQKMAKSCGRLS